MDNGAFRAALLKRLSSVGGASRSSGWGQADPGSLPSFGGGMGADPPGSSFLQPVKDPAGTRRGSSGGGTGVPKLNMGSPVKRPAAGGALPALTAEQEKHLAKIRVGIQKFGRARAKRAPKGGRL